MRAAFRAIINNARRWLGRLVEITAEEESGDVDPEASVERPEFKQQDKPFSSETGGVSQPSGNGEDKSKSALGSFPQTDSAPSPGEEAGLASDEESERSSGPEGLDLVLLSEVEPEEVRWLWPGWIPLGKLTLLDGDPGLGKSVLTLDLAARVTRATEMPDGKEPDLDEPGGVVLLTAEDGLADTIRPRLDAADAEVERVAALRTIPDDSDNSRLPTVQDVDEIHDAIQKVDAALVIVDPLTAYMGHGTDTHRDSDVRGSLAGLVQLGEEMDVAVLAVRHLNKSEDLKALYRGGGSIAFTASARSVLLVAEDPSYPGDGGRVLAQLKSNLARQQESLAFHLPAQEEPGVAYITWDGLSTHTPTELLRESVSTNTSPREQAKRFLKSVLAEEPVPADDLMQRAQEVGIAEKTLRRAKKDLEIKSAKEGFKNGRWRWMPPETESSDESASGGTTERGRGHDLATFDEENGENPCGAVPSTKAAEEDETGDLHGTVNPANAADHGHLQEGPDASGDVSDRTPEDGQSLETEGGSPEDAELDEEESTGTCDNGRSSGRASVPAAWVGGEAGP